MKMIQEVRERFEHFVYLFRGAITGSAVWNPEPGSDETVYLVKGTAK